MSKFLTVTILFLIFFSGNIEAKKLYKWVDENGQVHYSDQVPPDQIKKKHEELNQDGVVLEKVDRIKNEDEIRQERAERRRQIESEKLAKEEAHQRKVVIQSYTNEGQITRLKSERIAALERNIELARQSLNFQKTSKEQLLAMAADNERNGIKVSSALKSRIATIKEKIDYQIKFIKNKEDEIEKVEEKFVRDLEIYREAINAEKHATK